MRPLLWKEVHDLRPWVLGAGALVAGFALLCRLPRFEAPLLDGSLFALLPFLSLLAAIGLAMGQIARERHTRTLDFLLVRPVSPAAILWTKFLAGSVALAVVLTALVALLYTNPGYTANSGLNVIRGAVGFWRLLPFWLPRYWCLYAVTLLCSTLTDRTGKAAGAAAVCILTGLSLLFVSVDLLPFTGIEVWLPGFDGTGALVRVVQDSKLLWITGAVSCALALLTAWFAATLLQRSSERHLGNRALVLGGVGVIAAAILAGVALAERLPVTRPSGSVTFTSKYNPEAFAADRGLVCVVLDDGLAFFDFSDPAHARKVAEQHLPLWSATRVALSGADAYLIGKRKSVPADEMQILPASLTPEGSIRFAALIPLGPPDPSDFTSSAIPSGGSLYVSAIVRRQCLVRVFDIATHRETAAVTVDTLQPNPGHPHEEPKGGIAMQLRAPYLYVTSPSWLTTLDLSDSANPRIASRLAFRDPIPLFYAFQRDQVVLGNLLLEPSAWPQAMRSYNLIDPSRPAPAAEFTWHRTENSHPAESRGTLYQPWREGIIAFRRAGARFEALRYLHADPGYGIVKLSTAGGLVYTLGYDETAKQQRLAAFPAQ